MIAGESIRWTTSSVRDGARPLSFLRASPSWGGVSRAMYVHMFAFRWKPGVTEEQKLRVTAEIRGLQERSPAW